MAFIANWRIRKWQKKAATAYFIIGQKATTSEEREWAYHNAYIYAATPKQNSSTSMLPLTPSADASP